MQSAKRKDLGIYVHFHMKIVKHLTHCCQWTQPLFAIQQIFWELVSFQWDRSSLSKSFIIIIFHFSCLQKHIQISYDASPTLTKISKSW